MINPILCSGVVFLALTGSAMAAPQKETFRDWTASLEEVNTGEDLRKTCRAMTSGDDLVSRISVLGVTISDGDVLPPDAYPAITLSLTGPDWPTGEAIAVIFDTGGKPIEATASSDGSQLAVNNMKETSLALLRAMAAGSTLDIAVAGKPIPAVSLRGFTAAYRKLGVWCGFPADDVAK